MSDTVIFLGPSLDLSVARAVLDAHYLPPIKRGDLGRIPDAIRTVGIIDGEFYQNLAVSPKEILPLLQRGVQIYGSSSIGALRAAETCTLGMIGIGVIFEWYRDEIIDADDEVAVVYNPETYRALSQPLVNIRFALASAVREGLINDARAEEMISKIKAVYFPDRSYRLLTQLCPEIGEFLLKTRPDQKRDDALLLLRTIAQARLGQNQYKVTRASAPHITTPSPNATPV